MNWLSAGISYRNGRYLEDKADQSNRFHQFDASVLLYFLNTDKFSFFGNLLGGYNTWRVTDDDPNLVELRAAGPHFGVSLGAKWIFTKYVGVFFDYRWDKYWLTEKSYTLDGQPIDPNDEFEWTHDVRTGTFRIGIAAKFGS